MKHLKLGLAWVCYYIGHFISLSFTNDILGRILYPVYNKFMIWSYALDTDEKIWKDIKDSEE